VQRLDLAQLDDVRALLEGHAPGELADVYVKVAFPVHRRGVRDECMWVQVVHWREETLEGILVDDPVCREDLRAGSYVRVDRAQVVDYLARMPDGTSRGNALGSLLNGDLGLVPISYRPGVPVGEGAVVPAPTPP
jgi:hypothetical protein